VSVFVRRRRDGCSFEDFVRAWGADQGFGVPTRVFNAQSLEDPRDIISIGFVALAPDQLPAGVAGARGPEAFRHERIDEVIASTSLRCMYDLKTEHDFTLDPRAVDVGSAESLPRALG
jgi:hypothetical protein